jgi:hypothetical protein
MTPTACNDSQGRLAHAKGGITGSSAMAGPQQPGLLRGVVASLAMPAIVRHPVRRGSTTHNRMPRLWGR